MIESIFTNYALILTPAIIDFVLIGGTIVTFIVSYIVFNGISEGGGINWEAVPPAIIAAACFASLVLSLVNSLFLIAFAIAVLIITYVELGGN